MKAKDFDGAAEVMGSFGVPVPTGPAEATMDENGVVTVTCGDLVMQMSREAFERMRAREDGKE